MPANQCLADMFVASFATIVFSFSLHVHGIAGSRCRGQWRRQLPMPVGRLLGGFSTSVIFGLATESSSGGLVWASCRPQQQPVLGCCVYSLLMLCLGLNLDSSLHCNKQPFAGVSSVVADTLLKTLGSHSCHTMSNHAACHQHAWSAECDVGKQPCVCCSARQCGARASLLRAQCCNSPLLCKGCRWL